MQEIAQAQEMAPTGAKSFPENLPSGWKAALAAEKDKDYFKNLARFLSQEHQKKKTIYPAKENVLRALQSLELDDVKVVILGQDPYHGAGQAIGLSFAVPNSLRLKPPSLQNIFKEIQTDLDVALDATKSDLSGWVKQGVLLLNTVLTVQASQAFSHRDKGWETFTTEVIRTLNAREKPMIFLLWGSPAQKKAELIDAQKHFILKAPHPSPLSAHRGFFGCKHFSKANEILEKLGQKPIDWAKTSLE